MANGDLKETFGSQYAGGHAHAGVTAEVVATKALEPSPARYYSLLFVGTAVDTTETPNAGAVDQEAFLVTVMGPSGESSWAIVATSLGSNGTLANTGWAFAMSGDTLQATYEASVSGTNAISGGQFYGMSVEGPYPSGGG